MSSNQEGMGKMGGPSPKNGKAVSSKNATRHGILSPNPVVEGVETTEEWEEHRRGVAESLCPAGYLENKLTEHFALLLWRRDRITRYETEVMAPLKEEAERKLYRLRHPEKAERQVHFLTSWPTLYEAQTVCGDDAMGLLFRLAVFGMNPGEAATRLLEQIPLPAAPEGTPPEQRSWTAGMLRRAVSAACEHIVREEEGLLGCLMATAILELAEAQKEVERERELENAPESDGKEIREMIASNRRLPSDNILEKISRYEAHLTRQIKQTFDKLKALQVERKGQ